MIIWEALGYCDAVGKKNLLTTLSFWLSRTEYDEFVCTHYSWLPHFMLGLSIDISATTAIVCQFCF